MTDEHRLAEITALGASAPVLIADGHHRYETACTYATECRTRNGDRPGPYDLALAFVVELSEEELSIRAVHRLVKGISPDHLEDLIAPFFRIEPAPEDLVALPATAAPGVIGLFTTRTGSSSSTRVRFSSKQRRTISTRAASRWRWTASPSTSSATSPDGTKRPQQFEGAGRTLRSC